MILFYYLLLKMEQLKLGMWETFQQAKSFFFFFFLFFSFFLTSQIIIIIIIIFFFPSYSNRQPDPTPFFTFRGHQSAVLSLAISDKLSHTSQNDQNNGECLFYSGGQDGTIRQWRLMKSNYDIFTPYSILPSFPPFFLSFFFFKKKKLKH